MSKITLSFMQRFMGELDTAIRNYVAEKVGEKQNKPTYYTQTLTAGTTSVTFTNLPTTGNKLAELFITGGLSYISIDDSTEGTLVVTYEAQQTDVTVYLKLEDVEL